MLTNAATGEVTVELGGKTFVLHATMPRLAKYQSALSVKNLSGIHEALQNQDVVAIDRGLRCLCSSDNTAELDTLLLVPNIGAAIDAIYAALLAGLPPDTSDQRGK